jgi:hypothetical protein
VENRGRNADQAAIWSIAELQALLDEWLVSTWQNRPHDGLRDPLTPGRALTPNEKYAALVEAAGYVPVPLSQNDYIELLPVEWPAINAYGVKIRHRKYQSKALRRYSRQPSGVKARKDLWEVLRDPYDVSRIWVRNHHDGGWLEATWTHLNTGPVPFGDLAWDHAQRKPSLTARARPSPPMTLQRWRRFIDTPPSSFTLLSGQKREGLDDDARESSDDSRISHHSQMVIVATSLVREVARQGRLLTLLNRRETGARRMMILSGLQTTGKTTALKQLGRTHELRDKMPGRTGDRIPVAYVSAPPKGSPRKLAAEFARRQTSGLP